MHNAGKGKFLPTHKLAQQLTSAPTNKKAQQMVISDLKKTLQKSCLFNFYCNYSLEGCLLIFLPIPTFSMSLLYQCKHLMFPLKLRK